MTNAELIEAIRENEECNNCAIWKHGECDERKMSLDAADALEAADEKIADYTAAIEALDDSNDAYIKENERLKKRIAELEEEHNKTVTAIFGEEQLWWENRCKELEAQMPKECEFKSYADKIPNARNRYCTQCGAYLSDEEFENHTIRYCYWCGSKVRGANDE